MYCSLVTGWVDLHVKANTSKTTGSWYTQFGSDATAIY